MDKVKVAAVSYLNTKPLLYGFRDHPVSGHMQLSVDFPSRIAQQLIDGTVDLGLVPVAIIPFLPEHYIISDYCIGAEGPVASVCLFSDVPLEEIREVYLDYQSRTSVVLARLLLQDFWKITPALLPAEPGYEEKIGGTTAGVVIGDRAFVQRKKRKYIYDLAEAWINHTGLPFVFAAWISNKALPAHFEQAFNEATGAGLQGPRLEKVIAENPTDLFSLHDYYTRHISFELSVQKRRGLAHFLESIKKLS
ncbi:menaquinone biosynthesis protein [Compostibacter hankyongensis]|uniref:Chorismate dehydratase n=1 Tax=Compostibacter hankyongensis TaxID=1007089 RepID=A0ABP8FMW0_9BACT